MYSLPSKKTVNAPTIEAVRNRKNTRIRFFQELDIMALVGQPEINDFVTTLKQEYKQKPVVTINKYLSGIVDPERRRLIRNKIYNIKSPC